MTKRTTSRQCEPGCYFNELGIANVRVTCGGGIYIGIGEDDDLVSLWEWAWAGRERHVVRTAMPPGFARSTQGSQKHLQPRDVGELGRARACVGSLHGFRALALLQRRLVPGTGVPILPRWAEDRVKEASGCRVRTARHYEQIVWTRLSPSNCADGLPDHSDANVLHPVTEEGTPTGAPVRKDCCTCQLGCQLPRTEPRARSMRSPTAPVGPGRPGSDGLASNPHHAPIVWKTHL